MEKKKKIANCSFLYCLKIPTVGRLYQSTESVWSNGNQVYGERLATRKITQLGCPIAEGRCKSLTAPHSKAPAQTLSVHFSCWKMWPQSFVPGGQMLIYSRAELPFTSWEPSVGISGLQSMPTVITSFSCEEFSCFSADVVVQTWVSPMWKKNSSFRHRNFLSLCWAHFSLCPLLGLWSGWDSSLPGGTDNWLDCHFSTPSRSHSQRDRGCETLGQEASISLHTVSFISLVSYSKFLCGSSSSHHVSLDYLDSVK